MLGLVKSRELIAREARDNQRNLNAGNKGAFKKASKPWNAGLKGVTGHHPNCRATQFKPGSFNGRAAKLVMPIGSYRVNADGYLDRKVSDQPGPHTLRWRAVHRMVWEAAHGPAEAKCVRHDSTDRIVGLWRAWPV
ncbi:MAG: hypothetical protein U1F67_18490 [Rubrivivax sp.]